MCKEDTHKKNDWLRPSGGRRQKKLCANYDVCVHRKSTPA